MEEDTPTRAREKASIRVVDRIAVTWWE